MLFTSLEFLLLFFPLVFGINYILPKRIRNYWILLSSLFFYAWGEPAFVLVMIASIVINYLLALWLNTVSDRRESEDQIEQSSDGSGSTAVVSSKTKKRKWILALALVWNLGLLFVFKYLNFFLHTIHSLFPQSVQLFSATEIVLPIGISFFTFQALSYVIDVYRGLPAQKNIGYIGLYISLFPQLIAGPIVRYTTVMDQIVQRKVTVSSFTDGILRFMVGFNKKMLLANVLAEVADRAFAYEGGSVCMAWLGAICYSMQIYFDFSGYSDMAIGMGQMLGFHFLENFNYPYISRTITEFWRRWHISLGTWFRDYVYFPLGGSRVKTRGRLVFNLMSVWLLTGIWHGANWTFFLWGFLFGIVIVIEKTIDIPKKIERWAIPLRAGYRLFTLFLIVMGWVLFRADTVTDAMNYLAAMFGLRSNAFCDGAFVFFSREYIVFLFAGVICCTPILKWIKEKHCQKKCVIGELAVGTGAIIQLFLFIISVSMLVINAHNPFIYFNF